MSNVSNSKKHAIVKLELFNMFNLVNLDLQDLDSLPKLAKKEENISEDDLQLYFQSGYEAAINSGIISNETTIDKLKYTLFESSDGPHEVVISFKLQYRLAIQLKKVDYIINSDGNPQQIQGNSYDLNKNMVYYPKGANLELATDFLVKFLKERGIIPEPNMNDTIRFKKSAVGNNKYVFIFMRLHQTEEQQFEDALQSATNWQRAPRQENTMNYNDPSPPIIGGPAALSNTSSHTPHINNNNQEAKDPNNPNNPNNLEGGSKRSKVSKKLRRKTKKHSKSYRSRRRL